MFIVIFIIVCAMWSITFAVVCSSCNVFLFHRRQPYCCGVKWMESSEVSAVPNFIQLDSWWSHWLHSSCPRSSVDGGNPEKLRQKQNLMGQQYGVRHICMVCDYLHSKLISIQILCKNKYFWLYTGQLYGKVFTEIEHRIVASECVLVFLLLLLISL